MSSWRQRAACAGVDPMVFFPDIGEDTTAIAKDICRRCPVITQCLEDVLLLPPTNDPVGIFGGTGPEERKRIRRARKKEAAA